MKILTPFVCLIVMSLIWPKIAPGQMRNLDRFQKLIVFGDSLPDISLTPAVIARGGPTVYAAKHFVDTANNLLAVQVHLAASNYLVHANVVDINSLFTELVTEPTDFGFKNSVQAAFNPNTGKVVRDPNDFLFWDGFHPTTNAHFIAAEFICRAIISNLQLFEGSGETPLAKIGFWWAVGSH
jgi:phospholipase/lecithinase/hemolysin